MGLRNFERNYNRFDFLHGEFGVDRSVHSSYFQAVAETGYVGGAVFVWLIAYAFWITLRVRKRSRLLSQNDSRFFLTSANALLASLTVFAVGGAFAAEMMNELNWFTFESRSRAGSTLAECRRRNGHWTGYRSSPRNGSDWMAARDRCADRHLRCRCPCRTDRTSH